MDLRKKMAALNWGRFNLALLYLTSHTPKLIYVGYVIKWNEALWPQPRLDARPAFSQQFMQVSMEWIPPK